MIEWTLHPPGTKNCFDTRKKKPDSC